MDAIRTALGIITFVADVVAIFQIVRQAVARCLASSGSRRARCSPPRASAA